MAACRDDRGLQNQPSPLVATPKTLRISPLAAPKITPRMIVSAWLLRVWSQHGGSRCLEGRPTSARPRKAAVGLPSFSELLGAYLVGARRTVLVTGSGPSTGSCALRSLGLAAAQGTKCYGIPHWPHCARAADLLECGGAWLLRGNSVLFLCYANPLISIAQRF